MKQIIKFSACVVTLLCLMTAQNVKSQLTDSCWPIFQHGPQSGMLISSIKPNVFPQLSDTSYFEKFEFIKSLATDSALAEFDSGKPWVVENASFRLVELADRGAINDLLKYLEKSINLPVEEKITFRRNIFEALSRVTVDGDDELINTFLMGMRSPNWMIRATSVLALGRIGNKSQIPVVTTALKEPYYQVRQNALLALSRLGGEQAISDMASCISDSDPNVRQAAAYALGTTRSEKAIAPLGKLIHDKEKYVRQTVAHALGMTRSEQAIAIARLATLLGDTEKSVRQEAASALGRISSEAIAPVLVLSQALLNEKENEVKCSIIESLGNITSPKSIDTLQRLLKKGNFDIKIACIDALGKINKDSLDFSLAETAKDNNPKIRLAVARVSGASKDVHAISILSQLAQDIDMDVRVQAVSSLANVGGDKAKKELEKLFSDTLKVEIFKATVEGLDKIGAKTTVSVMLLNVLSDPKDQSKAEFSAEFLSNYPETKNEILQLLNSGRLKDKILAKLITTLSHFGDRGITQYLIEFDKMKNWDSKVRKSVLLALGELGDPASVPYLQECLVDKEVWIPAAKSLTMIPAMDFTNQLLQRKDDLIKEIKVPTHTLENLVTVVGVLAGAYLSFRLPSGMYVPGGTMASSLFSRRDFEEIPSRAIAAEVAGRLRLREAINSLSSLLFEDQDAVARTEAAYALARIESDSAARRIVSYLAEPNFYKNLIPIFKRFEYNRIVERMKNWRSLAAYYPEGIPTENVKIAPYLVNILERYFVIQSLNESKGKNAIGILLTNLYSPESGLIRQACVTALGEIGDKRAIPPLLIRLQDKEPYVKYAAAIALRKLGVEETEPALVTVKTELMQQLESQEPMEKLGALRNLAELHFDGCADLFLQMLENSSDTDFRLPALLGLSQLKDPKAVDAIRKHKLEIIEYLRNPNQFVRLQAVKIIVHSDFEDADELLQRTYKQDGSFLVRETARKMKETR